MDKWIVYVDELEHALLVLRPWVEAAGQRQAVQWLVVGCPPRVTHHASKWVTHSARESWRASRSLYSVARRISHATHSGTCTGCNPMQSATTRCDPMQQVATRAWGRRLRRTASRSPKWASCPLPPTTLW